MAPARGLVSSGGIHWRLGTLDVSSSSLLPNQRQPSALLYVQASSWPAKYFEIRGKCLKTAIVRTEQKPRCKSEIREFWRRGRDSNPRYPFGYAGFQDRSHQPLGHLSAALIVLLQSSFYGRGDASEAENSEQNTRGWPGFLSYAVSPFTSHFCLNNPESCFVISQ